MANSREIIINKGAPGGCPTCNPTDVVMNSPQSHRLAVGSAVRIYVRLAITNATHPVTRLMSLKLRFGWSFIVYIFIIRIIFLFQIA